jgi:hypothetical protein
MARRQEGGALRGKGGEPIVSIPEAPGEGPESTEGHRGPGAGRSRNRGKERGGGLNEPPASQRILPEGKGMERPGGALAHGKHTPLGKGRDILHG